jgi:predicted glycoside hydrolase/deacetylase ChbG (UPF0249 family)
VAATPERRRLIVNADDLGISEGVNRGILEAHEAGAVTSASVMVNLPAFGHAVRLARGAPALGTGLHFNILAGRPLTLARSLVHPRTGAFLPLPALVRRALAGRIRGEDVLAECAAQLDMLQRAGLRITHVDSHRHVHVLPGIWPAVVRAAREAGVPHVRVPVPSRAGEKRGLIAAMKQALLAASFAAASRAEPARTTVRFEGISLMGGTGFEGRLLRFLGALPPGVTELMVHPGHDDAELAALDGYRSEREVELRALCSPTVQAALRGFELTHFGRL